MLGRYIPYMLAGKDGQSEVDSVGGKYLLWTVGKIYYLHAGCWLVAENKEKMENDPMCGK